MVISHMNHYFEHNNEPILKKIDSEETTQEKDETVKKIKEVLDT